jgi:hypothetical protein
MHRSVIGSKSRVASSVPSVNADHRSGPGLARYMRVGRLVPLPGLQDKHQSSWTTFAVSDGHMESLADESDPPKPSAEAPPAPPAPARTNPSTEVRMLVLNGLLWTRTSGAEAAAETLLPRNALTAADRVTSRASLRVRTGAHPSLPVPPGPSGESDRSRPVSSPPTRAAPSGISPAALLLLASWVTTPTSSTPTSASMPDAGPPVIQADAGAARDERGVWGALTRAGGRHRVAWSDGRWVVLVGDPPGPLRIHLGAHARACNGVR